MAVFDVMKGLWTTVWGPSTTSAPATMFPLVINSDGSINAGITGGSVTVTPVHSATGIETSVAASATAVTILAANSARNGGSVVNDSTTGTLYLLLSSQTPTTSLYTIAMGTGGSYFEIPFGYTGVIKGIWDIASGNARVMEYTA